LRGTYGVIERGFGGRDTAAGIGLMTFDGAGGLTGRLIRSVPAGRVGERDSLEMAGAGRYGVSADGLISAGMDGAEDGLRLAVRGVGTGPDGAPVAQELAMIGRDLDGASGCLMTGTAFRRPDGAEFGPQAMQGLYVGAAFGEGGLYPAAGFGFLRYDGRGGFREANLSNIMGDTAVSRRFVEGSDEGSYTLDADGFGTVAGGGVRFVVTHATVDGGSTRVQAYAFVVQGLVPATGALFTGTVQRVGD
jgi:hypothetical protein